MMKLAKQEIYFGRQFTIADTLERIDEVAPEQCAPRRAAVRAGALGLVGGRPGGEPREGGAGRRRERPRRPCASRAREPEGRGLDLPRYQSEHAAGMDLLAALEAELTLAPGERALVSTGIALAIPPGYEGQVRPRSGLAIRDGVTMLNAPGTIDADYRGTVRLVVVNHGAAPVTIRRGERLAQLVVARVERAELELVDELPATGRGAGGFGSTGR